MTASLAERLGYSVGARIAIIHCDDMGLCPATTGGGFDAMTAGVATCGSVMVPCADFPNVAALARAHPDLDLGVHLTLNAEWESDGWGPVAGASAVPSLVDARGFLHRTAGEVLARARIEEVAIELRAQIELALEAGIDVTHLDAHMGTAMIPPLVDVYVRLALEYRLPVLAVRPSAQALAALGAASAAHAVARALATLEQGGVPILDGFDAHSLDFSAGDGEAHNRRRLAGLAPGVHYLICHPARVDPAYRARSKDAHAREFEHAFYGGEPGRVALAAEGIDTLGMRALRQLMRR
jgi:predicted glycoside hydrolase/deacetylase ChbG (UPF0249 family)